MTLKYDHPLDKHVTGNELHEDLSVSYWEGMIRSSVTGLSDTEYLIAARVCKEFKCGTWHAASVVTGNVDTCQCFPCVKRRRKGSN